VTTTRDLGRTTRQIPPHPGDDAAQRIRAILKRLKTRDRMPAVSTEGTNR
jgi:hypothetical protein